MGYSMDMDTLYEEIYRIAKVKLKDGITLGKVLDLLDEFEYNLLVLEVIKDIEQEKE